MPASIGTAPGKIILAGEHAVVYGRHAIAVPVSKVQAKASIFPRPDLQPDAIKISAPDIQIDCDLSELPTAHPFAKIFALVKAHFKPGSFSGSKSARPVIHTHCRRYGVWSRRFYRDLKSVIQLPGQASILFRNFSSVI